MAWSISNAMMKDYENSRFSQELAAASSEVTCSDGGQSQPLNTTPTPDQFYWPDKTTEHSRLSRFGMMCEPLTESLGEELLMWFLAGFPARTLVPPEKEQDWMENEVDYGGKWRGSLAKYSLDTSTWKTAQSLLLGGLEEFSETWPKWGLMRNGECWELPILGLPILESESGSWPTPCKTDGLIGWSEAVTSNREKTGLRPSGARIGYQLNYMRQTQPYVMTDGRYHPNLSEWLMWWPMGWTGLQQLEMGKFQSWQQQHGGF